MWRGWGSVARVHTSTAVPVAASRLGCSGTPAVRPQNEPLQEVL